MFKSAQEPEVRRNVKLRVSGRTEGPAHGRRQNGTCMTRAYLPLQTSRAQRCSRHLQPQQLEMANNDLRFDGEKALSEPKIYVSLTYDPLDTTAQMARVKSPKAGAVVLFAGMLDAFHSQHLYYYTSHPVDQESRLTR